MAETIDDYPTPATSAMKEWWGTLGLPKTSAARAALIAHFSIDPDAAASAPQRFVSTLFSKFVRDRG
jgi:hypothetical protein